MEKNLPAEVVGSEPLIRVLIYQIVNYLHGRMGSEPDSLTHKMFETHFVYVPPMLIHTVAMRYLSGHFDDVPPNPLAEGSENPLSIGFQWEVHRMTGHQQNSVAYRNPDTLV